MAGFPGVARQMQTLGLSALLAGALLTTPTGIAQAAEQSTSETPPVQWGACDEHALTGVPPAQRHLYSCGHYPVPIDHDHPEHGTIDIALMRRAAQRPDERIGSLFMNPGGPATAGYNMAIRANHMLDQDVRDRFDVIGFDPRGVARSAPLRCFASSRQHDKVLGRTSTVPVGGNDIRSTLNAYHKQGMFCDQNAGELLRHMSTKDTAQDLDVLRRAVGDEGLSYVGLSYGTLIGATYANMFGEHTRAIVNDGNVDPELRTSDGVQYDRERAQGFEHALSAFLERCSYEGGKCAFSAGEPRAKFDEIRERLHHGPLTLPGGRTVTLDDFTSGVADRLFDAAQFQELAADLQRMHGALHPGTPAPAGPLSTMDESTGMARRDALDSPLAVSNYADDAYFGVNCTDKQFPRDPHAVPEIAGAWEQESPTFGRYHAFNDPAGCSGWPETDPEPYSGPWDHDADNPVLTIGNFHDPATQYEFSRRMTADLGNAVLISVDAFGHCILGKSSCVDRKVSRYLIGLAAPGPGEVCQPDHQPWA